MKSLLLVFLGGGLGSTLRFIIGKYFNHTGDGFPYGTFAVNIMGSLLIGIILGLVAKNTSLSQNYSLFLATGFCGGFTTFSAFAYENQLYIDSGDLTGMALYTIASFVLGIAAVFLGLYLVNINAG